MKLPIPYQGDQKYIFISYSHKDISKVDEIICKFSESGYNVWFDSGIVPGSEWDENIAQHIEKCGCFIAFMSENYLESNNCKDELNYARDLEKDRLVVYLEEVTLPSGLAMRINRLQSVFKYAYKSDKDFYDKLFSADCLEQCRKTESTEDMYEESESFTKDFAEDFVEERIKDKENAGKAKKKFSFSKLKINKNNAEKKKTPSKTKVLVLNIVCTVLMVILFLFKLGILPSVAQLVFNAIHYKRFKDTNGKKFFFIWLIVSIVLVVLSLLSFSF